VFIPFCTEQLLLLSAWVLNPTNSNKNSNITRATMAIARRKTKSKNTKVTQVEQNTISSVYHSELEQFIKRKQQKQHKTASKS